MAQLGPAIPSIHALGAQLVVVGSGAPFMAKAFLEDHPLDAPLYVDPSLHAFEAAGLKRGMRETLLNRASMRHAVRALAKGHMQGSTQGDPWQQGGTFVVWPGGKVTFQHVAGEAGDHAPNEQVLAALKLGPG